MAMGSGHSILIVDDSEHLCNAFRWILEDDGYPVHTAPDGRAALVYLTTKPPPALILLDRGLPDMTGLDVAAAILASPKHAKIPIVLMSGAALTEEEGVGDLPVLLKPVDTTELLVVAHRYAGR